MHWLKQIVIVLMLSFLLLGSWLYIAWYRLSHVGDFLTRTESPTKSVFFGDLGGIPVIIPDGYGVLVEYQEDPPFFEPLNGRKMPKHTPQSKLRSFGFEVRYPDMAPATGKNWRGPQNSNHYTSMWLDVGVSVAPFNNEIGLRRQVDAITPPGKIWVWEGSPGLPAKTWKEKHGYLRSPKHLYDLVVYEVQGYDEAKRHEIPGNGSGDENIYYHENNQGKVDTYIRCNNIKHDAAQCEHSFVLPTAKDTIVEVGYRIGLLPHWRDIQERITQVILGFAIDPKKP